MNCVEKYRGQLIRKINRELRVLTTRPDETAIHEFRVGMKRLSALFYFLGSRTLDREFNRVVATTQTA